MRRIHAAIVSSCFLATCFSYSKPSDRAVVQTMKTLILSEGSVPPAFELFGCIHKLDDRPFSSQLIQDCVSKLRSNHFIRDVRVHTREMDDGRWVSVEFVLSSESVKVDDLTIKTFDGQEPDIWKMLSKSDSNLHVGGMYSWDAESSAYNAITFLYRAQYFPET